MWRFAGQKSYVRKKNEDNHQTTTKFFSFAANEKKEWKVCGKFFINHFLMFDEYLLRQLTSFVRWIQYLVVEDWKVKRQTQSNGMCGLHFAFTNFKGILVCGLAVIHYGWNFSYHLWLQIPRLWKEGNYKGMRFWVTYCCVFRRLQLQPNICSNRLSFSNRRLCFLDCWLWEWGICPRVPEITK